MPSRSRTKSIDSNIVAAAQASKEDTGPRADDFHQRSRGRMVSVSRATAGQKAQYGIYMRRWAERKGATEDELAEVLAMLDVP